MKPMIEASTITRMGAMISIHSVQLILDITARGVLATLTLKGVMYENNNIDFIVYSV